MKRFYGKVIIITGSSSGIGKCAAKIFGRYGAKIILNARTKSKLEETECELKRLGYDVIHVAGDVADDETCRNIIDKAISTFGKIDILINNAGISMRGAFEAISPCVVKRVFNTTITGPLLLTNLALPYIKKEKGSIVFISSLAALRGIPHLSVYSSAKMALTAIVDSLQIELAPYKVHTGIVYAGITRNEKGKTVLAADGSPVVLNERKHLFSKSPEFVAQKIMQLIAGREKQITTGFAAALYRFCVRYFPWIIELLTTSLYRKMKKLYN
jgi:short-subunit dehydrogenase